MMPIYVTQSSCGVGTWHAIDTSITPLNCSWSWGFISTSVGSTVNGDYKIEGTIDNPISYGPTPPREGSIAVNVSSLLAFLISALSSVATGVLPWSSTMPVFSAWRINQQSSGLTGVVTFLQMGKKQ
jgi:hypothetical protein